MTAMQASTRRALVELSEDHRERAMSRLQVLLPHLDDGVPVTRAASAAGVPLRTARRWLPQGLAGLAPPLRSGRASRRFRPELVGPVEGLYLRRPAPSAATVHRAAG